MALHELKTWPEFFEHVLSGDKTFEARQNDRDFHVGDELLLREFQPKSKRYTGREARRFVTYLLAGPDFGIAAGHVVMALRPAPSVTREQELEAEVARLRAIAKRIADQGCDYGEEYSCAEPDEEGHMLDAKEWCDPCRASAALAPVPAPPASEPTREALLESVVRDARAYCEEMLSPEWLADPANRNIFGARIYALLAAAKESR